MRQKNREQTDRQNNDEALEQGKCEGITRRPEEVPKTESQSKARECIQVREKGPKKDRDDTCGENVECVGPGRKAFAKDSPNSSIVLR